MFQIPYYIDGDTGLTQSNTIISTRFLKSNVLDFLLHRWRYKDYTEQYDYIQSLSQSIVSDSLLHRWRNKDYTE